ncbi:riboflavin synthase subunit alpha [Caldimicrobium thiodismutans]|uniref:Riboflavin synthase n=1 Tax=Caldimicrobium thiodismutans TaxID=1653476 RepID=A0A0U5AXK3_9BACT|nr:riboflavin synthase [Caldimicrobium thiodismutans]BAU23167.1 riboflavin synthase subunit alpha [Caldimicrobium thiodismutans]
MFTGLIEGKGIIRRLVPQGQGFLIEIESEFSLGDTQIGDSIAVDGICLTATKVLEKKFTAQVSPETIARTTLKIKKAGDEVNLERALKLGASIGGHLVSGHVDATGKIINISKVGDYYLFEIEIPQELSPYLIPKGSIAVDGISLTINEVSSNKFALMIIPHTYKVTTLSSKKIGDFVNLEVDMIAKMVYQWAKPYLEKLSSQRGKEITLDFLKNHGFL